jgi:hypothetical protein
VKIDDDKYQVPADAIEALARQLLPAIRAYYESDEGQAEFAEWQARQTAEKSTGGGEVLRASQAYRLTKGARWRKPTRPFSLPCVRRRPAGHFAAKRKVSEWVTRFEKGCENLLSLATILRRF